MFFRPGEPASSVVPRKRPDWAALATMREESSSDSPPDRVDRAGRSGPGRVVGDPEPVLEGPKQAVVVVGRRVHARRGERADHGEGHVAPTRELLGAAGALVR